MHLCAVWQYQVDEEPLGHPRSCRVHMSSFCELIPNTRTLLGSGRLRPSKGIGCIVTQIGVLPTDARPAWLIKVAFDLSAAAWITSFRGTESPSPEEEQVKVPSRYVFRRVATWHFDREAARQPVSSKRHELGIGVVELSWRRRVVIVLKYPLFSAREKLVFYLPLFFLSLLFFESHLSA